MPDELRQSKIMDRSTATLEECLRRYEDFPGATLSGLLNVHRNLDREAHIVRQHGKQFAQWKVSVTRGEALGSGLLDDGLG